VYKIAAANSKVEKKLYEYASRRVDINDKFQRIKEDPRRANGAHPLHGKLTGKWSCWLGSNIRMIYVIGDAKRLIIVMTVGSHKVY